MFAKYTLNYEYEGSDDYAPCKVSFEIPGDVTIDQLLFQFECFLKACSFQFDGNIIVAKNEDCYDWSDECGCKD